MRRSSPPVDQLVNPSLWLICYVSETKSSIDERWNQIHVWKREHSSLIETLHHVILLLYPLLWLLLCPELPRKLAEHPHNFSTILSMPRLDLDLFLFLSFSTVLRINWLILWLIQHRFQFHHFLRKNWWWMAQAYPLFRFWNLLPLFLKSFLFLLLMFPRTWLLLSTNLGFCREMPGVVMLHSFIALQLLALLLLARKLTVISEISFPVRSSSSVSTYWFDVSMSFSLTPRPLPISPRIESWFQTCWLLRVLWSCGLWTRFPYSFWCRVRLLFLFNLWEECAFGCFKPFCSHPLVI